VSTPGGPARDRRRSAISVLLLLSVLALLTTRPEGDPTPLRRPLDQLPEAIGGWSALEDQSLDRRSVEILQVDDYLVRDYVDEHGKSVSLYIGFWRTQRRGATVHSPKNCLPGNGWEPTSANRRNLRSDPAGIEINHYVVQREGVEAVVLYWYEAAGVPIASETLARLAMVKSAIIDRRTDGAIVRLVALAEPSSAEATARLERFALELRPLLAHHLP